MQYQWIEHPNQVLALAERLKNSAYNALDTEFLKVDTLYPKLGLLQVNVNQQIYLVDGKLDLSHIWSSVFGAKQNIFHACGEDVDLIYHYAQHRPLRNVFDTQIAMSFLGYGRQVGYQAALEQVLNVNVEKDQTRSDWLARPLSDDQIRYAVTDVYYLQDLADQLIQQLHAKQHYDFVIEDCQTFCLSMAEHLPLNKVYLDVANYRHSPRQLMQLKQLTMWREKLAEALNQPRSYILKNITINKLLERTPKTLQQLSGFEIKSGVIRQYGQTILQLLNQLPDPNEWPVRLDRPYRYRNEQTKIRIDEKIETLSAELDIPDDILMRKKWLAQLTQFVLQDQQDLNQLTPYLTGWRLKPLTLPLIEIIREEKGFDGL